MTLTVNIFWFTDEEQKMYDAGVEVKTNIEDAQTKEITFYNIDHIKPYDERFCEISVCGEVFIANESYLTIKARIEKQKTWVFNYS